MDIERPDASPPGEAPDMRVIGTVCHDAPLVAPDPAAPAVSS